jgi:hypothetical protein
LEADAAAMMSFHNYDALQARQVAAHDTRLVLITFSDYFQ